MALIIVLVIYYGWLGLGVPFAQQPLAHSFLTSLPGHRDVTFTRTLVIKAVGPGFCKDPIFVFSVIKKIDLTVIHGVY